MCLIVAVLVSGCEDASSDPLSVTLPDGAVAGLVSGSGLPSFGSLAVEAGLHAEWDSPLELWSHSWDVPVLEGRELRQVAYDQAVETLADALGPESVERAVGRVGAAVDKAGEVEGEALGTRILEQVALARESRDAAQRALEAEDLVGALSYGLVASDLLREVGPESVIRIMIREAEGRLETLAVDAGEVSAEDIQRGRRLTTGARVALESGDWERAALRAYYACQLLGIQPD